MQGNSGIHSKEFAQIAIQAALPAQDLAVLIVYLAHLLYIIKHLLTNVQIHAMQINSHLQLRVGSVSAVT